MAKIKVAFCTDGIYPLAVGGMQKHSRHLVEHLMTFSELEITVFHPHEEKIFPEQVKEIQIEGIDKSKNYLIECYAYSKRIFERVMSLHPDIVYSQGLSIWCNARHLKERLIVNPHGLEPYQGISLKDKIYGIPFRLIFNSLFRQSSVVISLGGKLTRILSTKANVIEIPNAVNAPKDVQRMKEGAEVVRVLFLARFAHNKGIDVLFNAIERLNSQGFSKNFQFTLAGTGPLYEYYKAKNRFDNVALTGFVADKEVPGLYQSSDLFVLPTLYEGMPTVVLEAMSYGLPIIVSDVGATAALVNNGNGRLIRPGSVAELVDALTWFLTLTSEKRKALSQFSMDSFSKQYTWPVVAEQHRRLFMSLAENRQ